MLKVINLFGSSGTGKSTTRADTFQLMKRAQMSVEEITEFAKDLIWEEAPKSTFEDQAYLTGVQNHRQWRLRGKVEWAITDSPLLLGLIYAKPDYFGDTYRPFVRALFNSYQNYNFFLRRIKPFVQVGRNENEAESDAIAVCIKHMLVRLQVPFTELDADADAPEKILKSITQ
jgi:ABC-type dipeptide/oligopeptide/nickel transport system ATPase component